MKLKITIVLLLFFAFAKAQWKTNFSKSQFKGDIKSAYVLGIGGEFPYTKPQFVINRVNDEGFNMYLSGMGYTGCDGNSLVFMFNEDDRQYIAKYPTTDRENESLFVDSFTNINIYEFFQMLMKKSKMYVQFSNECNYREYSFSLSGSTRSLKYVLEEEFDKLKEDFEKLEVIKKEKAAQLDLKNSELQEGLKKIISYYSNLKEFDHSSEYLATIQFDRVYLLDGLKGIRSENKTRGFTIEKGQDVIFYKYFVDGRLKINNGIADYYITTNIARELGFSKSMNSLDKL